MNPIQERRRLQEELLKKFEKVLEENEKIITTLKLLANARAGNMEKYATKDDIHV